MATPDPQDAAARDRIIKHMNADHQDSLRRYLELSEKAWYPQLRSAQMTDITTEYMKFSYADGKKTATIPFDPPMKSLREARERLVAKDKETLEKLHRSDITLNIFIPPYANLGHLFNWTVCFLTFVTFARAANFEPGSLLYDNLLSQAPAVADFCLLIRPWLFWIMLAIHGFESGMMGDRLDKHGLSPFQLTWWKWMVTSFIEGRTSFWRLDSWVAEKQKQKEKDAKKH